MVKKKHKSHCSRARSASCSHAKKRSGTRLFTLGDALRTTTGPCRSVATNRNLLLPLQRRELSLKTHRAWKASVFPIVVASKCRIIARFVMLALAGFARFRKLSEAQQRQHCCSRALTLLAKTQQCWQHRKRAEGALLVLLCFMHSQKRAKQWCSPFETTGKCAVYERTCICTLPVAAIPPRVSSLPSLPSPRASLSDLL